MNLSIIKNQDLEIFLPVKGYEGLYEVSNWGRVFRCKGSVEKKNRWGKYIYSIRRRELKQLFFKKAHYCRVNLSKNNKEILFFVHRLVATVFLSNPLNLPIVKHLDNNPQNNHISNLEWATQSNNVQQAYDEGRGSFVRAHGEEHIRAKLTDEIVRIIRNSSLSGLILAQMYKVNSSTIYAVKQKRSWKHIV